MMFLTKEEVQELTGYKTQAKQCMWLTNHGWKFEVSAIGRPVVLRRYAEERLSDAPATKPAWEPKLNLDVIRKKRR